MAFDELTLESFIWENTMRAADAVAPNLPYPPEERLPVRDMKPLARSKCRRRRRGTPPRLDADCGSQWRFLRLRACAPPRIVGGVEIWRIDDLLTQNFTAMVYQSGFRGNGVTQKYKWRECLPTWRRSYANSAVRLPAKFERLLGYHKDVRKPLRLRSEQVFEGAPFRFAVCTTASARCISAAKVRRNCAAPKLILSASSAVQEPL